MLTEEWKGPGFQPGRKDEISGFSPPRDSGFRGPRQPNR